MCKIDIHFTSREIKSSTESIEENANILYMQLWSKKRSTHKIEQEGDLYAIVTEPMHKGDWSNITNWNNHCNGTEVREVLWTYIIIDA